MNTEHPLTLWLKAVGKTEADFARELDMSRAYVNLIVKGQRHPRLTLLKISDRTGIPYDRLKNFKQQEAA